LFLLFLSPLPFLLHSPHPSASPFFSYHSLSTS
jgi:hypothetical protein